jgi:hypothetical protein
VTIEERVGNNNSHAVGAGLGTGRRSGQPERSGKYQGSEILGKPEMPGIRS